MVIDGEADDVIATAVQYAASTGPSMVIDGEDVPRARHDLIQDASTGPSMVIDGEFAALMTFGKRRFKLQRGRRW